MLKKKLMWLMKAFSAKPFSWLSHIVLSDLNSTFSDRDETEIEKEVLEILKDSEDGAALLYDVGRFEVTVAGLGTWDMFIEYFMKSLKLRNHIHNEAKIVKELTRTVKALIFILEGRMKELEELIKKNRKSAMERYLRELYSIYETQVDALKSIKIVLEHEEEEE